MTNTNIPQLIIVEQRSQRYHYSSNTTQYLHTLVKELLQCHTKSQFITFVNVIFLCEKMLMIPKIPKVTHNQNKYGERLVFMISQY